MEYIGTHFDSMEQFYLYAREESCQLGGLLHGTIIAGHTPTIVKESFDYNAGDVFRYYDKEKDCIFMILIVDARSETGIQTQSFPVSVRRMKNK